MTTTINASTSSGLVQTADTSGVLQLQTANTTAVTIDASQNVGIGTSSPSGKLDVIGTIRAGVASNQAFNAGWSSGGSQVYIQGYNSGTAQYVDTAVRGDNLLFYTNAASNTEKMRITSGGDVGIGVASPAAKLDISTTTSYGGIKINGDGGASISFYQPLSNASARNWRIVSNYEAWGTLDFQRSADNATAPTTTQLTINNAGTLVLKGGAITNSGVGVAFPATQVASSDANTLDDYEEGTWTPALSRTGTAPTISYASRNGRYTKIGNQVTIQVSITNITVSSAGTGDNSLSNLPFPVVASTYDGGGSLGFNDAFVNTCYAAMINTNANTYLVFRGGTGRSQSYESGGWSTGGYFSLSFTYFTNT